MCKLPYKWFHTWSKWEPYKKLMTYRRKSLIFKYEDLRQTRMCEVCGKLQDVMIKEGIELC